MNESARKRWLRRLGLSGSALLLASLTGCDMGQAEGTMQLPVQASAQAVDVDWCFYFVFWANVFYFVHIMAIMGYFMWRYRARPGEDRTPEPSICAEAVNPRGTCDTDPSTGGDCSCDPECSSPPSCACDTGIGTCEAATGGDTCLCDIDCYSTLLVGAVASGDKNKDHRVVSM